MEILVFLVFAGMALPIIWRMRGLSILRSALSHEPLYMRVAAFAFFAATVIYGGGKGDGGGDGGNGGLTPPMQGMSAPPSAPGAANGGDGGDRGAAPTLPDWFTLAGHDDADADGDDIPDCWERWTGTNPIVADSSLDADSDGLSNLDEFWLQTDPQCADTDNDAIDDALEAAAMFAGVADFDPLAPATYAAPESDANTNGIPDTWEDTSSPLFSGVSQGGFPNGCYIPEANGANYDVSLTVSSSRFALLSWGEDDSILLPPCTNLALRLRLDCHETRTVSLSAVPDGAPGGLLLGNWRADMTAEWTPGRDLETEGDRLETGMGTMVDRSSDAVSYRGAVVASGGGSPPLLRGGAPGGNGGAGGGSLDIHFSPKWMELIYYGGDYCAEHGPSPFVELLATNVPPPYLWAYDLHQTVSSNTLFYVDLPWLDYTTTTVTCREADGAHTNLAMQASINIAIGHCEQSATNILPITALAGFDVMTNHAAKVDSPTNPNGVNCPEAQIVNVYASWEGGYIWDRNFETIPTGDDADDLTSHCIAIDWTNNHVIALEDYLPQELLPFKDELSYRVNGNGIDGSTIPIGKKPKDLLPTIYHVEMLNDADTTLDRLWIVVLNPDTRTKFNTWANQNPTNATWFGTLPKPPSKIFVSASGAATLPSAASANWNAPEPFPTNNYMHPKAVYELRSNVMSGGHGHQATYDSSGNIVTESIKAGTADFASPSFSFLYGWHPEKHREEDVKPYIRALQLDGNPVSSVNLSGEESSFWTRNLSRPPLRVGPFSQQYLQRRPTTPSGVQLIQ
ncbi:MAG: hypothetical protein IKO40_04710 [Kiritimatiellae bacterium]|nr:hypothetical protein [Kiritimatiellia bacterium]